MDEHTTPLLARTIKTARTWAGKSRAQLALDIGVATETVARWERGDWKTEPPKAGMIDAVQKSTKVPRVFLTDGWDGIVSMPSAEPPIDTRLKEIEESIRALRDQTITPAGVVDAVEQVIADLGLASSRHSPPDAQPPTGTDRPRGA